jgi:hypothetical protein
VTAGRSHHPMHTDGHNSFRLVILGLDPRIRISGHPARSGEDDPGHNDVGTDVL